MGSAQGRITIRRRPKDGNNGIDGIDGKPGDDAVVYEIVTNVDTLRITDDYVAMSVRIIKGSVVTVIDNYEAVEYYGLTFTAKIDGKDATRYIDATEVDSQIYWGGSGVTLTKKSKLSLYLWEGGVCVAEKVLNVVADGEPGIQGIQGCILRTTEWVSGTEYRNDEALTSGTRFIDIVVIKDGNTGEVDAIYMCKETHTASDANKPDGTSNTYWNKFNTLAPIYTPMIFADKALLRISQTNQLLVADDDGNVIGVFGGGRYPLQVGDNFKVDQGGKAYMTGAELSGKVTAGDADGRRVEIQPENKQMAVFDENGEMAVSYEGNIVTELSKLFSSKSGDFSLKTRTSTIAGFGSGTTYGKGKYSVSGSDSSIGNSFTNELVISNAVQSDVPIEAVISGTLKSEFVNPGLTPLAGTTNDSNIYTPEFVSSASASIVLRVDTYSDSGLTNQVGSAVVWRCGGSNETKTLSSVKAKTAIGGYHVLKLIISITATGSGASASVSWGSAVSDGTNLAGSFTTESKVARYFANGFCLGNSDKDYTWLYNQGSTSGGMRVVMENNGYGLDVSQKGVKVKHHGGAWMNMPMLVINGRVTYNSSSKAYSVSTAYSKSFDGAFPTATRSSEGKVRLTFPSSWVSALSPSASNLIINATGYGYISGSTSNLIKANVLAITSSYIDIGLSDDQSANDGDFLINISII